MDKGSFESKMDHVRVLRRGLLMMKKATKVVLASAFVIGATLSGFTPVNVSHATPSQKIVTIQQNHKKTIEDTLKLATQGKTINSEKFGIQSKGKDIKKKWGKPDPGSDAENLSYSKKKILFQLEKDKVLWITSYDKKFEKIKVADVKKVAGKPQKESKGADAYYLKYKKGKHILEFAFYYNDHNKPDTIKEVNVYVPSKSWN